MSEGQTKPVRVFEYLDYREFLREKYAERKREHRSFSYRYIAGKCGISAGLLTRILKGQRSLNPSLSGRLASVLGLQDTERDFFEILVLFGQAKSHSEKNHFLEKILRIRATKVHTLGKHQFEYFRTWQYSALRELLNFYPFEGDLQKLSRMLRPPLKVQETKKALQLLIESGLIEKQVDGSVRLADKIISSGERIQATLVNNLHVSMAELAIRAIQEMDPMERDFSSLTLSLSPHCLEAVKAKVRKFRKEILEMARQDTDVNGVYQMNFHVFPLSHRLQDGKS